MEVVNFLIKLGGHLIQVPSGDQILVMVLDQHEAGGCRAFDHHRDRLYCVEWELALSWGGIPIDERRSVSWFGEY